MSPHLNPGELRAARCKAEKLAGQIAHGLKTLQYYRQQHTLATIRTDDERAASVARSYRMQVRQLAHLERVKIDEMCTELKQLTQGVI